MPSPAQIQYNRANGLPDWYEFDDAGTAQPTPQAAPPANANQPIPAWLAQQDAQEAQQAQTAAPTDANKPIPDWLQKQDADEAAGPVANSNQPLPKWYFPEPEQVTVTADQPSSIGQDLGDLAANLGTGIARIPGSIIGTPHVVAHVLDWLAAKVANLTDGGNRTGADLDESNPLAKHTLTSEDVDNATFKGISAVAGRPVAPYEPTSFIGKLLQAGVTGAGAGLVDPAALMGVVKAGAPVASVLEGALPRMAKTAVAADAANATGQVFPDEPGLAAGAALVAHTGASGVGSMARSGGGVAADATRQLLRPSVQGDIEAGRVLGKVDNTAPGLAAPTDADLSSATGDVRDATNDIGPGLPAHMAGADLRAGLQARADALRTARSQAGDAAYDQFRAQPPLPSAALEPLMRSPGFRRAVSSANAAVLDEGGEPMTDYWDFDANGDPALKPNAAIPPDVLGRVKSWTAAAAANAPAGSAEARTAAILDKRVGNFLDQQYPASGEFPGYAAVRNAYAQAGKPLADFAGGPVEKALEADRQYGQSRYVMPDERLPDLFLRSKATRSDLNQLIAASGGDRAAALSALQDYMAGVAQSAVRPDGTVDAAAFDKVMKPYQQSLGNLGVWFPELAQKFNTVKQAQATLDNLQAQRSIADAVTGGALRDGDGVVTGPSFSKWLRSNQAALAKTQSPAALMRLQQMASILQGTHPGELADALKSEILPATIGTATAGLEGGVLATLLHRTAKTAFGSLDAKRQAAFSAAIEQAVKDPAYAARLAANAARQGHGVRPVRALVRAMVATPLAVNAGGSNKQRATNAVY
jgi:hypothetical protein